MQKIFWTKRTRGIFALLIQNQKKSLRDLKSFLNIQEKGGQNCLVRSLARLARLGLLDIDKGAPRNFPRYSITSRGKELWNKKGCKTDAQVQVVPSPQSGNMKQEKDVLKLANSQLDVIRCPECGRKRPFTVLHNLLKLNLHVFCDGCGHDLTQLVRNA